MESASSLSSHALPSLPFSGNHGVRQRKLSRHVISSFHDRGHGGRLVDENMIVLRQRIHEMERIEGKYEAPSDWMDWEKRYYDTSYDSDICEAMGFAQSQLMNTRPSLALGMAALLALSLPTSLGLVSFLLAQIANRIISSLHG